jgi:hypothetical protein
MLQVFIGNGSDYYMTRDAAQQWDQRPFRSMLIRKWVKYRSGHGFYVTREGRDTWNDFHHRDISRANPLLPLTSYFEQIYGPLPSKKAPAVHVMPTREARSA